MVHPGAGNHDGTLVNALLHHCKDSLSGIGGVKRPGIVHRLDKNTSGVMVAAKNDIAHTCLSEQFADHGRMGVLERKYLALVWGQPPQRMGTISNYLARSKNDRTKRSVVRETSLGAKLSITHYRLLEEFRYNDVAISMIECRLETGRTHQIRVHMSNIGTPLIADDDYGSSYKTKANKLPENIKLAIESLGHQALHAYYLQFAHPESGKVMKFESDLPEDLGNLLNLLKADSQIQYIIYN